MYQPNQNEKIIFELFKDVITSFGSSMLIPRTLSEAFLDEATRLNVFISGITTWTYAYNPNIHLIGIGEEYPYEFWVGFEYEDHEDSVSRSVEMIRKHIQQLPDHIHLLGFEIF